MTQCASGRSASRPSASTSTRWPFHSWMLPAMPRHGASAGMPSSRADVGGVALRAQPGLVDGVVDDALVRRAHAVLRGSASSTACGHAHQRVGAPRRPAFAGAVLLEALHVADDRRARQQAGQDAVEVGAHAVAEMDDVGALAANDRAPAPAPPAAPRPAAAPSGGRRAAAGAHGAELLARAGSRRSSSSACCFGRRRRGDVVDRARRAAPGRPRSASARRAPCRCGSGARSMPRIRWYRPVSEPPTTPPLEASTNRTEIVGDVAVASHGPAVSPLERPAGRAVPRLMPASMPAAAGGSRAARRAAKLRRSASSSGTRGVQPSSSLRAARGERRAAQRALHLMAGDRRATAGQSRQRARRRSPPARSSPSGSIDRHPVAAADLAIEARVVGLRRVHVDDGVGAAARRVGVRPPARSRRRRCRRRRAAAGSRGAPAARAAARPTMARRASGGVRPGP